MHLSAADLAELRVKHRAERIGLITGNFNVVHPGHLRLIKYARSLVEFLVIALHPDGGGGAYVEQELRLSGIRALGMVDLSFIMQDDIRVCMEHLKPDLVFKGAEHEAADNPESEWLREWGGKMLFCTDDPRFSLDDLILGMLNNNRPRTERMPVPVDYLERHGIGMEDLERILDRMAAINVCVVGDLIVDEYVLCNPLGMSREDPTLVVSPLEETRFIGGAGIVAGHAAGLGGSVHFVSVAGDDEAARYAYGWLRDNGVNSRIICDPDRPTTTKRRYKAHNKTLLRVNNLSQQHIDREYQAAMLKHLDSILDGCDILIFSDFSYGVLPPGLAAEIATLCRRRGVAMTADSQSSSQVGDLGKFKDTLLVTPTELEARHAMRNFNQGLVALAAALMGEIRTANIIITLGEDGCLINADPAQNQIITDKLPSLNRTPLDVAGAGDSFLTTASIALAAGANIWQAALLGSVAAGVQVGRMGNIPLCPDELRRGLGLVPRKNTTRVTR